MMTVLVWTTVGLVVGAVAGIFLAMLQVDHGDE